MTALLSAVHKWTRRLSRKEKPIEPRPVFCNDQYNKTIQQDGVVYLPWLSPDELSALKNTVADVNVKADYDDVHVRTPFMLSAFNNSAAYKQELYDRIYALLRDKIEGLLHDYEPLVINVFEKAPNQGFSAVAIHQNPSFVEEPYLKSVSVWIPLQDVCRENGTLGVLKGSHDTFFAIRSANMPDVFEYTAEKLQEEWFEPVVLQAGEIAVLDDSLIHWSYPNDSQSVRTAVQLIMVPRNVPHIYSYYNESGCEPRLDLYEVTPDFFFRFNCKAEPQGLKPLGNVPYRYFPITEKELLHKVSGKNTAFTSSIKL